MKSEFCYLLEAVQAGKKIFTRPDYCRKEKHFTNCVLCSKTCGLLHDCQGNEVENHYKNKKEDGSPAAY